MTVTEQEILQDLKAYVDRCLFEDRFEECLMTLAGDASDLLMDVNQQRRTAGEYGRLIIPGR